MEGWEFSLGFFVSGLVFYEVFFLVGVSGVDVELS